MRGHRIVACLLVALAGGAAVIAGRAGDPGRAASGTKARRIVTASPALAEGLFAIEAGDRLVGVSRFVNHPPPVKDLPQIGGFLDPNLAAIEALAPDAILVQGSPHTNAALGEFARERGIAIEWFQIETIGETLVALERLGRLTGHEVQARAQVDRLARAVAGHRARTPRVRPRVLLSFDRTPGEIRDVATAGAETFIMECLAAAGGETLFPDFARGYRPMSKEAAAARRPDVILELRTEPTSVALAEALERDWREALPDVPAVKNGRVHVVRHEAGLIPGPRLDQVIETLAAAIHSGTAR